MRAALHVLDAVPLQLRLELGAAAPGGVLAALIGQDLAWRPVLGDAAGECLQHQHASLMVRNGQAHQIARVIVQERRHVQPLVPAQEEREQIRLPQLVRLRPLEVLHGLMPPYPLGHHLWLDAFVTQHPTHRRRRDSDPQEPLHAVADAPAASQWLRLARRQDGLRLWARGLLQVRPLNRLPRLQ